MYLGSSGMKAQLKYADRRDAPAPSSPARRSSSSGKLQVKDLVAGKEQAAATADNRAWREERPGQFEVARDDLVAEVEEAARAAASRLAPMPLQLSSRKARSACPGPMNPERAARERIVRRASLARPGVQGSRSRPAAEPG